MDVSIIIVNYNGCNLTKDCINSIVEYTQGIDYEIIVVDNASCDESVSVLSNDRRIKFIESGDNLGFGKANNLGVVNSTGKYIFFLNNDTLLLNNAIKLFYDSCEQSSEKLGAVGCLLEDKNGNVIHSYAKQSTPWMILKSYAVAPFSHSLAKKLIGMDIMDDPNSGEVGYVTGADLFVNKSLLSVCGGFDPDFFMYCEESEMQNRFRSRGYKNVIIDAPRIVHLEGMSTKTPLQDGIPMRKILMTQKSLLLYVKKTSTRLEYTLFRFLFPIIRIPFLLLSKYSFLEKKQYLKMLLSKCF